MLATALWMDEQSKCPGCGCYSDEAHDPEMDGGYEVEEVVCQACAARGRWQADRQGKTDHGVLTSLRKLTKKAKRS